MMAPSDSSDLDKSREQLLHELAGLRRRYAEISRELAQLRSKGPSDDLCGFPEVFGGNAGRATAERERLLRHVMDNMVAMIGLMTPDGTLIRANRTALEAAGLEPEDVLGKPCEETYWWAWSPEVKQRLRAAIARCAAGEGSRYDEVIRVGENAYITIDFMLAPMFGPDGRVVYLIPSATDITERKQAEEALKQSELFHRQMLESIPGMGFTTRPDGYCDYQSQQWVEYTGVPMSDHLGDGWNALLHPEDRPRALAAWRTAVEEDAHYDLEYRVRRKDGVFEWFRVIGRRIRDDRGRTVRWFGVAMNIEQLKQTEGELRRALAEAEERRRIFEAMMEHIPMGITVADSPDVTIRAVSRYGLELTGKPRKLIEGIPMDQHAERWEIYRADSVTPAKNEELPLTRATLKGELIEQEEWVLGRSDGQTMSILCTAAPIRDRSGNITGGVTGYQDITGRKRMEERLRISEKRFRELADSMPQLVWTADPDGTVDYYNARYRDYSGIDRLPDGTFQWSPVLHAEDEAQTVAAWQKTHQSGEMYQIEHRVQQADGSYRWHLSRAMPVRDETGRIVKWFGTATDIEELRQAEAKLRQLNETLERKVAERTQMADQRSRQLQRLAVELVEAEERERRRIARLLHDDLQQMLAAANMQLRAAVDMPSPGKILANVTSILSESIEKTRRLSHELSPPALHRSGLVAGLEWLAEQMKDQFGLMVVLSASAERPFEQFHLKTFIFRAAQELLFNIVKHAGVKSARIDLSVSNHNLVVRVNDRGKGFDPGILQTPNAKVGLGLISLRERALSIGGRLAVESAPGWGSRFTLTLPCDSVDADAPNQPAIKRPISAPQKNANPVTAQLRLVLAHDHQVIRQGLIQMIGSQPDIEVVGEASNGREAVDLVRRLGPDVVIMDAVMAGVDGIDATRRIKAEIPHVRIIGLSMSDDPQTITRMHQAGAEAFLKKTASKAELLKVIYGLECDS